jgi:hypothetical protein
MKRIRFKQTLDDKFFQYHDNNPHVFKLFVRFAREAKNAGFKHYGMHTIMHRVRWHINVETNDEDGYKMNNNYSSRYARLLMQKHPEEFEGFFNLRKLQTYSILRG